MKTTFSSKVLVLAAAAPVVLALGFMGCSGDDSTPPKTDSGATTSAATTTTTSGSATTTTSGSATTTTGTVTDAGGDADATTSTGPLTLTGDVYPNLLHLCVSCHGFNDAGAAGGGISAGHLDMGDAAVAYEMLVGDGGGVIAQGTPAVGGASCAALGTDAGLKRVMPGDPAHSLLWNKLASNDGDGGSLTLSDGGPEVFCGVPMPLHLGSVGANNIKMVSDWIEAGAKK
jgi:hypothetical protein